jgi:hypothetical protein
MAKARRQHTSIAPEIPLSSAICVEAKRSSPKTTSGRHEARTQQLEFVFTSGELLITSDNQTSRTQTGGRT